MAKFFSISVALSCLLSGCAGEQDGVTPGEDGTGGDAVGGHTASGGSSASTSGGSTSGGSTSGGGGGSGGDTTGGDATGGGDAIDPTAAVFADDALPTFELTLSASCRDALAGDPTTYCAGGLRYVPGRPAEPAVTLADVGIRLKGRASFRPLSEKASFKIKVDEFISGQRLHGLRRLTLNNMVQDPSALHERLGYRFYRAAGLPAPLCNHARVYVNGEYYGLYANVQTLDDEFAERLWDPAPGNLYDTPNDQYFVELLPEHSGSYELETNQDLADRSDLEALIAAVNGPSETFETDAGLHLDWSEWHAAAAAQAVIADWDGYFGARNNYKLYHELERDRFLVLPWGIDQTFGYTEAEAREPLLHLDYALDHSTSQRESSHVFQRCAQRDSCWERYLDAVETALSVFESLPLEAELNAHVAQTEAALREDTRREDNDARVAAARAGLVTFIQQRGDRVRDELTRYGR